MDDAPRSPTYSYTELLEAAYDLGRVDGRFEADFTVQNTLDPLGSTCRGRDPAEFARLLWGDLPGRPPSGLELNAPRWYLRGYADALAERIAVGLPAPIPAPRAPMSRPPAPLPVQRRGR
jgi:hypothetical protein